MEASDREGGHGGNAWHQVLEMHLEAVVRTRRHRRAVGWTGFPRYREQKRGFA